MSRAAGKEPGLEENFAKLEATIERLETEDISLEDAFAAYSEGMMILKTCNGQIDRVEKQVLKLTEQGTLEAL
ncbi:MAG: exodeoxyribonuclease VII small subunit [Lachnospiraceae bacterium]|nr:exodeoxyribonuclease VII small subunit [Lachnospiraceae bacterium]